MSFVDVVVPCYRYGRFLRQCVESVLLQTGVSVRVLIIDDASPDDTALVAAQLCRDDARVTQIRHTLNKGHIATYNEGLDWVSSTYLLLLSADDYLLPDALRRSVEFMDAHPDMAFAFGNVIEVGEQSLWCDASGIAGVHGENASRVLPGEEFIGLSGSRNIVPTPTVVVRSALQKQLGGYRPELPHTGDLEMWLRLAVHGSVGILGACQAVYRRHANNMSHDYLGHNRLRDLSQRRDAIQWFLNTQGERLAHLPNLRRKMLCSLSRDAVSYASAAFNEGALAHSADLAQFALSVDPAVRITLPWARLALKNILGTKGSRALRPALSRIRRLGRGSNAEPSRLE